MAGMIGLGATSAQASTRPVKAGSDYLALGDNGCENAPGAPHTKDGCTSASEKKAVFSTITDNVHKILSAVRNRAHYSGQLAIVNYYSLDYSSSFITSIVKTLNKTVDSAAELPRDDRQWLCRVQGGVASLR
jgi:hypothetical protein